MTEPVPVVDIEPLTPPATERFSWKRRRRFMYAVATFKAALATYIVTMNHQGSVSETAVMFCLLGLSGMVGAYVFGAAWQDISQMKAGNTARYAGAGAPGGGVWRG